MKNLNILNLKIIFYIPNFLTEIKKNLYSFIGFFFIILNSIMVIKKLLVLKNLTKAQIFHIYKLVKVVIYKVFNLVSDTKLNRKNI